MNATEVLAAWDEAARGDTPRPAIHPSGTDEIEYARSGAASAAEVVTLARRHLDDEPRDYLDFGCGDARVSRWIDASVTGCDASHAMLDLAENWLRLVRQWDGLEPWSGTPVDVAFSLAVFIHHDHATGAAMLTNLATAVIGGGLVLVDVPVYERGERERANWTDVTTWMPGRFCAAATAAGLEVIEMRTNPGVFGFDAIGANHGRLHVLAKP